MGTRKEIAAEIREKEADYALALKGNQPILRAEVEGIFELVKLPNARPKLVKSRDVARRCEEATRKWQPGEK